MQQWLEHLWSACLIAAYVQECCQVYHKSSALAPDSPEKLIRARYSAFVKRDFKFLRDTSHPDNPALKGSTTAPDVEVQKHCTYEEDVSPRM
jgi:SEC-C motif-containing protein